MTYREKKTTGFIGNFVQCFWEYTNADQVTEHTILPDGYFDLIAVFQNNQLQFIKLTGTWTAPVNIIIPENTRIFAIRFKLLATEYLFRQEIKSIRDTARALPADFWQIQTYQSHEFDRFVADVSFHLDHCLKHLREIDNRKLELFALIYEQRVDSVAEIADRVFWSSRQINRYFNAQFGFPLKLFLKIVRCQTTYKDISNGSLYPANNYYDQAHFIKDVKKITGSTPKELFKNKNDRFLQLSNAKLP
ncbi:MAG TPA: helix-turn-helix domain-containing protein [Saprospiraceae bacterium]|nr:helix-turn-helix domain-containing protein [Saprospiraceae bacterium]